MQILILLSGVIVLLSKKFPLTFLLLYMFWKFMPSIFAYLKKIFICPFIFWKTFLLVTMIWVYLSFSSAFSIDVWINIYKGWQGLGFVVVVVTHSAPQFSNLASNTFGLGWGPVCLRLFRVETSLSFLSVSSTFSFQSLLCTEPSWNLPLLSLELQPLLTVCWAPTN